MLTAEEIRALGWYGDRRLLRADDPSDAAVAAARDYAASLGLEVICHEPGPYRPDVHIWSVDAGTPETWLAADKLCAFVDGLRAAGQIRPVPATATP